MKKSTKTDEPLNLYSVELKQHICDVLTVKGALSFRQLRDFVSQSFSVGALLPCLVEMRDEDRVMWDKEGYLVVCERIKSQEG